MTYIETRGNAVYISMNDLAERYGLCKDTIRDRKKGIEAEIASGRYPDISIIEDGNKVFINELVFLDYLKNRKSLNNRTLRKHVKPFRPADWVEMLGFFNRPVTVED